MPKNLSIARRIVFRIIPVEWRDVCWKVPVGSAEIPAGQRRRFLPPKLSGASSDPVQSKAASGALARRRITASAPRGPNCATPALRFWPVKTLPATAFLTPTNRSFSGSLDRLAVWAGLSVPAGRGAAQVPTWPKTSARTAATLTFQLMKTNPTHPTASRRPAATRGFTLVELLTVIAIIAILASMLLPVLSRVRVSALKAQARIQANDIATAVQAYDAAYGRFPVSPAAQQAAQSWVNSDGSKGGDFTYCGVYTNSSGFWPNGAMASPTSQTSLAVPNANSDVIAILMDYTNYPDGNNYPGFTVNTNYQKNPQKTAFLNAKLSGWDPSQSGPALPGVGADLVYRDPWGNPYIITMDLNYDGQCQDAFYGLQKVSQQSGSQGFNGLVDPVDGTSGGGNNYRFHGTVMVWSMGPNGPFNSSLSTYNPNLSATDGSNKNHILSWQ